MKKTSDGVYIAEDNVVKINRQNIDFIKNEAINSDKQRARICAHLSADHTVHEMLIALTDQTYVQPHRHLKTFESFHVIEGNILVYLFSQDGKLSETIELSDYTSNSIFFYRLSPGIFHTIKVKSQIAVIHETAQGPFDPLNTEFAKWAPPESDKKSAAKFMSSLL
jgi:cupin fold WbuC family metalloprotein